MRTTPLVFAIFLGLGCTSTPSGKHPSDETVPEQRRTASQLEREAAVEEDDAKSDPQAFLQWSHRERAKELRDEAKTLRRSAAELEALAQQACFEQSAESRATCPLPGKAEAIEPTDHGLSIRFPSEVVMEDVLAQSLCRTTYADAYGANPADECPLELQGLEVSIDPDDRTLEIEAEDEHVRSELTRRAFRRSAP